MLTLYGVARSRASRNLWLLYETGAPFDWVKVMQAYRLPDPKPAGVMHTQSPEFLAMNPAATVPVLKDGDLVLSELLAINLYVAKQYGGALGPKDPAEDALMMQWALYGMTAIEPFALPILYAWAEGRAETKEGRAEIIALVAKLARPMAVLNDHLATHGHMVGKRFTVADINMAEIIRYAEAEPGYLDQFPAIKGWYEASHARPAFKKMWDIRLAEPA